MKNLSKEVLIDELNIKTELLEYENNRKKTTNRTTY